MFTAPECRVLLRSHANAVPALTLAVAALALQTPAHAGPLAPSMIGRDAHWVAHIDMEAAVTSTLGHALFDHQPKGPAQDPISKLADQFGLSAATDIMGVTFYGTSLGGEDGVVLMVTTPAVDSLATHLASAGLKDFETHEAEGLTYFSWTTDDHPCHASVRQLPRADQRLVLLCGTSKGLEAANRVISAASPNITSLDTAESTALLSSPPAAGSILYFTAQGLTDQAMFQKSMLRQAQSLVIDFGEIVSADAAGPGAKETFVKVSLTAVDEPAAAALKQSMQMMLSLATLLAQDQKDKGAGECLKAVKISAEGRTLQIVTRQSSDGVLKDLKELKGVLGAAMSDKRPAPDKDEKEPRDPKPVRMAPEASVSQPTPAKIPDR